MRIKISEPKPLQAPVIAKKYPQPLSSTLTLIGNFENAAVAQNLASLPENHSNCCFHL
ncbi:hypothetical protein clem_09825 [Legionella clemsonensis]|uniref:Uncharacterized protein n=1 Tax=Legionella clemsonensis TaxID=1867846 RepID=A0A222P3T6_9GAMM|nr:hypothetical protein clem_09825 [Legionella clemsonensis]